LQEALSCICGLLYWLHFVRASWQVEQ
jgi:hypothetical protein